MFASLNKVGSLENTSFRKLSETKIRYARYPVTDHGSREDSDSVRRESASGFKRLISPSSITGDV